MKYLMGIDLGTTSTKTVIYDSGGNRVASASRIRVDANPYADHPSWTVLQPDQYMDDITLVIREAVSQLDDPREIGAIGVTGTESEAVPIGEDGRYLYPLISWQDERTEPQLRWWRENIGAQRQFELTGNLCFHFWHALRLLWMMEHEPEIIRRTYKWVINTDYLNYLLTGVLATDYTGAATTLLFDLKNHSWSETLLALSGIDKRILCDPQPSGTILGQVTPEASQRTGLAVGTKVVSGGHDYLCGALAAGAFEPGIVLDVTGTWEQILTAVRQPVLTEPVFRSGLAVETHVARGTYAAWGGSPAATMVEWFRGELGLQEKLRAEKEGADEWDCLIQTAEASPSGSRGAIFLPHMLGSSCPVQDIRSLGIFAGLSIQTTRADILRAIIEGLDYQMRDIVQALETGLEIHPEKIVAVGGAIKNHFWMQNKADVIGLPVEVPDLYEATPLGAAILAGIGTGVYRSESDAYRQTCKSGQVYKPNETLVPGYDRAFGIYKQLYPAMKDINAQIHDATFGN